MLKVDNLHVSYGHIEVLKGISFSVEMGEIVALIGGNGAGKTTTLRTISGLVRPARGHVRLGERDITATIPDEIVRLGVVQVPEGRRIFPRMTVLENLQLGAYARSDQPAIRSDMDEVFALFP